MRAAAGGFVGMADFAAFTDDDPAEKSPACCSNGWSSPEAGALYPDPGAGLALSSGRWCGGSSVCWRRSDAASCGPSVRPRCCDRAARRGINPAALTAPAAGLFLEGVYYDGDAGPGPIVPLFPLLTAVGPPPDAGLASLGP